MFDDELDRQMQEYQSLFRQRKNYSIGVVVNRSKASVGYSEHENPDYMVPEEFMKSRLQ